MRPTRKRPGSSWMRGTGSRSSTSSRLTAGSFQAISISPRSRGLSRRCRRPSSTMAATVTASSPFRKSIPTITRSRLPTGRPCYRSRPARPPRNPARRPSAAQRGAGSARRRTGRRRTNRPPRRGGARPRIAVGADVHRGESHEDREPAIRMTSATVGRSRPMWPRPRQRAGEPPEWKGAAEDSDTVRQSGEAFCRGWRRPA